MKVVCISDTHGYLPEIPDCDLLLHGGDIIPLDIQRDLTASMKWLRTDFTRWINKLEARNIKVLAVWGNHDFVGENGHRDYLSHNFLTDRWENFKGLNIYGTPYQKNFHNWAFNLDDKALAAKYDLIPEDTDILLVHNPPLGILDYVESVREHCGSKVLSDRIECLKKLKLCVFGHISEGYGKASFVGTPLFVNASICDEKYIPSRQPIVIDIKL